jgi:hypothetical protein
MKLALTAIAVLVLYVLMAFVCRGIARASDDDDQDERLDEIEGRV